MHELVAAFVGFKPKVQPQEIAVDENDPSGIGALIERFPNGFVPIDR